MGELVTRHERDYLERTIATVRNHHGADNCWPQWANIFADEIERLWDVEERLRTAMKHVVADSPGTPDSVKKYLVRELEGGWGDAYERAVLDGPPEGYIVPEGDERCNFTMDACLCMKRKGHDGLHACAHGGWR